MGGGGTEVVMDSQRCSNREITLTYISPVTGVRQGKLTHLILSV